MLQVRPEGTRSSMTSAGYWPSTWPVECGGNHRPKAAPGPGLKLGPTDSLVATTRRTGRWPVMFVTRDQGQLYLTGTGPGASGNGPAGWVERVDPVTLHPMARSGELPAGGHEWSGSIAVHRNGDLYAVNGSYLHRLDPDCNVVAERELPVDHAHNGLLILDDGSLITKDIRLGGAASTLTVLDADLQILTTVPLPEPSMGRLAAEPGPDGGSWVYAPGTTRISRHRWHDGDLTIDPDWQPTYRSADRGGLAWDPTIADGRLWFHDNGSITAIERRFDDPSEPDAGLSPDSSPSDAETHQAADGAAAWAEPVRLIGIDLADPEHQSIIRPTELPGGWVISPPLVTAGIAVAWDTGNTGLAAFDVSPGASAEMLWFQPFRSSMHPLLYPASGELVTNDFRYLDDGSTSDDLVVLDIATGRMKARVATGAVRHNGMFLTPGWNRDLYYCGFETVARIETRSL